MPDTLILIVDDDRTVVRFCQRLLERASYQVVTASDPLDALKILAHQPVQLLLPDIRMPVMDGFELISQAKQLQPDLPVLVMTGFGSIENAIQALHRGVDGLILKPFENSAELVQTVQRVLDESRQRRDFARLQALRPLFDVTERLLAETSPRLLEELILNTVTNLFQASFAGIYRCPIEGFGFDVLRTTQPPLAPDAEAYQQRLMQRALLSGAPALISASGPGGSEDDQRALLSIGWETLMVADVSRGDTHFTFCAAREQDSLLFTGADLEMFVILARQAGVAMENARLYTDLKAYLRKVEDSQRALVQAEKMAAVGRLIASLAHEINNPLQSVRNCLNLAARKGLEAEQRLTYLEMMDSELDRLVVTVRRMLDFYRPGGIEKQRVNIALLAEQVLALLGAQLRQQKIEVQLRQKGQEAPVYGVPEQLQQVIFNLIINAMDAIEEAQAELLASPGGRQLAPPEKRIWIDISFEADQMRLRIEDSGNGIPADLGERVFEPFVSTKEHGTGLGLAVSYGIIEKHQGSLSITSPQYGKGACLTVTLPMNYEGGYGKNINS